MKNKPVVLVVDKNVSSSVIMTKRLNSLGFHADTVTTAQGAIDYLHSSEDVPDLVLVNLNEDDESLINLPSEVKEKTRWEKMIPFAALSALVDKTLMARLIRAGYSDLMIRPIDHEMFKDRIDKLLKKSVVLSSESFKKTLNEEGSLLFRTLLLDFNEYGVTAQSSVPLAIDTQLALQSPSLTDLLSGPVQVRVVSCTARGPGQFEVVLSFIGLGASEIRAFRKFAISGASSKTA